MLKLKLPRPAWSPPAVELPPALRPNAPAAGRAALVLLTRRQLLKGLVALLAFASAPLTRARRSFAAARGRYFSGDELRTLEALCDRILPPDTAGGRPSPGGKALGAATYIDRMLAAFEGGGVPRIYAGGPFSGRAPLPDNRRGRPSARRPRNDFARFVPLTRLQEIRWRAELYGSDAPEAPGADFNDAALGPLKGLRPLYRESLARVNEIAETAAGAAFARLPVADQDRVLEMLLAPAAFAADPRRGGRRFGELLIQHAIEGCFSAPEYGGNRGRQGWKLIGLEGDSQPLGFSIFSKRADAYRERATHPMSTPNPDELGPGGTIVPRPLSAIAATFQQTIAVTAELFPDC